MTGFRGRTFETKLIAILFSVFAIMATLFLNLFEFL